MIPIVYRWDDGNAPVARGERRSLCDILYACLVTGYGTKPGAGWTRPYVNATFDKAAFRNNSSTGTGFYLQVDGYGAPSPENPKIMGYEVMTGVSSGLRPFVAAAAAQYMWTSNLADTTAHPWILVADDRAFYLTIFITATAAPTNSDLHKSEMFFGDAIKWFSSDAYCSCLLNGYSAYGNDLTINDPSVTTGNICFPRNVAGVASPIKAALIRGGGPGALSFPGAHGLAYAGGDPVMITRPHVNNAAEYTFRGWLPGFYYPCHPLAFNQLATVTADGKNYLSITGYLQGGNGLGNYFIGLDDWRA
ncbi:MAG: hypothetical protein JZU65_08530 [Chlorobium sp.]|nr:hypothetical protein [Chlorobium sp.]